METNEKIDFVVTWVNSNDVEWQKKMNSQLELMGKEQLMTGEERYHDFGFFRYWFRAVEKYASWVNHIYLVTDSQIPSFFKGNKRVTIIDHKQFIPQEFLPTFSSSTIELFLDKIPGIEEKFVYFNDDMLLNNFVTPKTFFSESGLPKDSAIPSVLQPVSDFDAIPFNNSLVINRNFSKGKVLKEHFSKFFCLKYGVSNILKAVLTVPFSNWSTFKIQHIPYSLRKDDYRILRKYAQKEITNTAKMHFRSEMDINIWLLLELRFMQGEFSPRKKSIGGYYDFDNVEALIQSVKKGKESLICINDDSQSKSLRDKVKISKDIINVLEDKFPTKSMSEI
ncbi:stealth family protein [Pediococcus stilesii]|uniref:Cps2G protein n=1 Tax=Pediococcus stilesii TaxID=331679 RepID=A0A0R2KYV1_9LACO|nr:stealth family protein [Pediococcus stilesii]KRN94731.1 cps2G protein [Pediococcus stilesii]